MKLKDAVLELRKQMQPIYEKWEEWLLTYPCTTPTCKNRVSLDWYGTRINGIYCNECFDYTKNEIKK